MKKQNNFILISGRPGSGKTEMMIAYANMYPKTTIILSEDHNEKDLYQRNLSKDIKVVDRNSFSQIDINKYTTICIDYIELLDLQFIKDKIIPLMDTNMRIIILQQMSRTGKIRKNPFLTYLTAKEN